LLNWVHERYDTKKYPIYVTEFGFSCPNEANLPVEEAVHDTDRLDYFKGYTEMIARAISEDGVKIAGCFGWSLLDNFEWAEGDLIIFSLGDDEY
jgi:beta-glucosidase